MVVGGCSCGLTAHPRLNGVLPSLRTSPLTQFQALRRIEVGHSLAPDTGSSSTFMRFTLHWPYLDSTIKLSSDTRRGKWVGKEAVTVAWRLEMRAGTTAVTSVVGSVKV
jgi:hypothetical protein